MISLVVISVVAAVLYPTVAHYTPNSNKPLFKSAYKVLTNALSEITTQRLTGELDTTNDAGGPTSGQKLCTAFCNVVNVVPENGSSDCGHIFNQICNDNVLTTTNGMRWGFSNYALANTNTYDIFEWHNGNVYQDAFLIEVDVNPSNNGLDGENNTLNNNNDCSPMQALSRSNDGKGIFCFDNDNDGTGIWTTVPNDVAGVYNTQNLKVQDTFQILIDRKGKIISMSPAAWANLEDAQPD